MWRVLQVYVMTLNINVQYTNPLELTFQGFLFWLRRWWCGRELLVTAGRNELSGVEINGRISHNAARAIHNVIETVGAREIPVDALDAPDDHNDDGNNLPYLDETAFALVVEFLFFLGAETPGYAAQGVSANTSSTGHVVVVVVAIFLLFGKHLLEEGHCFVVHLFSREKRRRSATAMCRASLEIEARARNHIRGFDKCIGIVQGKHAALLFNPRLSRHSTDQLAHLDRMVDLNVQLNKGVVLAQRALRCETARALQLITPPKRAGCTYDVLATLIHVGEIEGLGARVTRTRRTKLDVSLGLCHMYGGVKKSYEKNGGGRKWTREH